MFPGVVSTGRSERLTDRQVAQVVSLYDDHTPTTVIAERFGVSRSTIYNTLRRSGIFRRVFDDKERESIVRRYAEDGTSVFQLATELGVYPGTIARVLRRYGITA